MTEGKTQPPALDGDVVENVPVASESTVNGRTPPPKNADDDVVDYDKLVDGFRAWVDAHPADEAPLNELDDQIDLLVRADASKMVADAIIEIVRARWPKAGRAGLRDAWSSSVKEYEAALKAGQRLGEADEDDPPVEMLIPWETEVDGKRLARDITSVIGDYVVFDEETDKTATVLWIIGSYFMDAWSLWPNLMVSSPTVACGKSTLLTCVESVSYRALMTANISVAAVGRLINAWGVTLIIDEADNLLKSGKNEMGGIINASHTKRSAKVVRTAFVDGTPDGVETINTWAPKVLAGIGSGWSSEALSTRSIRIHLRRKMVTEETRPMPRQLFEQNETIRRKLIRWRDDNCDRVAADYDDPEHIAVRQPAGSDRMWDNWQPMLTVARVLGGSWPKKVMQAHAAACEIERRHSNAGFEMELLTDVFRITRTPAMVVRRMGTKYDDAHYGSTNLLNKLNGLEGGRSADLDGGRGLTARRLGLVLGWFKIQPKRYRPNTRGLRERGYLITDIDVVAARYIGDEERMEIIEEAEVDAKEAAKKSVKRRKSTTPKAEG